MNKSRSARIISVLLALMMLFSLVNVPLAVFAEGDDEPAAGVPVEINAATAKIGRTDLIGVFGDSILSTAYYGFASVDAPDGITYVTLTSSGDVTPGEYLAFKTTAASGSIFNRVPDWSQATSMAITVRFYYEGTFTAEGHDEGEIYLNGEPITGSVRLYTDESYTITVREIEDYDCTLIGAVAGEVFAPTGEFAVTAVYSDASVPQEPYEMELAASSAKISRTNLVNIFEDSVLSSAHYGFAPVDSPDDITYVTVSLSGGADIEAGEYIAYKTTVNNGSLLNPDPDWGYARSRLLTVRTYYNATFTVTGHEDGEIYLNGEPAGDSARLFTDETYTVTAKSIDDYICTLTGAADGEEFTPSADIDVSASYVKERYAVVAVQSNNGGAVTILSGGEAVEGRVSEGNGFEVVPQPDAANGYYTESIEITKNGEPYEGASVEEVADGEIYTVTVVFSQAVCALDDVEVNIIDIKNGNFETIENAIIEKLTVFPDAFADGAEIAVEYVSANLLGAELYEKLDFAPGQLTTKHAFGTQSAGVSPAAGNTEKVRVTLTNDAYPGVTLQATATATVIDLRTPTYIAADSTVTITYGDDLKSAVLDVIGIIDEDGQSIEFDAEDITISPETLNVSLFSNQDVTVSYAGNDDYASSDGVVSVYVRQESASIDVKSETVTYGETPSVRVITTPEDLDHILLIAGIDGDAEGFLSIDIPDSTKESMNIEISGVTVLNIYDVLQSAIGDGMSLGDFQQLLNNIGILLEMDFVVDAAAQSGFDISSLQSILDIIKNLPLSNVNAIITLGNPPKDAGVYLVAAVSTDLNRTISGDVGYLAILPKTSFGEDSTVELRFSSELGENDVLTYAQAQEFEFGGELYDDGQTVETEHIHTLYFGSASRGEVVTERDTPIREPGIYTEIVYVLGGNYITLPIIRVYTVERIVPELTMEDKTVTFNGEPQGITAVIDDESLAGMISYSYSGPDYFGDTPPADAGTYLVTATFEGDETHEPVTANSFLTIEKAEATITVTCAESVLFGDVAEGDVSPEAAELDAVVTGLIGGDEPDYVYPVIKVTGGYPNVGEYGVTAVYSDDIDKNYNIAIEEAVLNIVPRPVTITINDITKDYGDPDPKLTYTVDGLENGGKLVVVLVREPGEKVGEYRIVAGHEETENYDVVIRGESGEYGRFTILARPIDVRKTVLDAPESGYVNEPFMLTLTTDDSVTQLKFYNEKGGVVGCNIVGAVPDEESGTVTWTLEMTLGTKGLGREFIIYDKTNDVLTELTSFRIDILSRCTPSVTAPETVNVNEPFEITVESDIGGAKPTVLNEKGKAISTRLVSATNENGVYTSVLSLSVGTAGEDRQFTVVDRSSSTEKEIGSFTLSVVSPDFSPSVTAPATAKVDEPFTIEVKTPADVASLTILNDKGSKIGSTVTDRTVENGIATWTVSLKVGTARQNRTFTVVDASNPDVPLASFVISIIKGFETSIISVSAPDSAMANEKFRVTTVVTNDLVKGRFVSNKGNRIGSTVVSRVKDGDTTTVVYELSLGTSGSRTLTFYADRVNSDEYGYSQSFDIAIEK